MKATGKTVNQLDETHIWRFGPDGKVVSFRHRVDTHAQHLAFNTLSCGLHFGRAVFEAPQVVKVLDVKDGLCKTTKGSAPLVAEVCQVIEDLSDDDDLVLFGTIPLLFLYETVRQPCGR